MTTWQLAPKDISLQSNHIHIWYCPFDAFNELTIQHFFELLSADEQQRALRFRFDKDRQHNIIARANLRLLLANYLSLAAKELTFEYSDYDKPFLSENQNTIGLTFNITHAKNVCLLAFSAKHNFGIDVESLSREAANEEIARRFFAEEEVRAFLALPKAERTEGFFRAWTRKEAFIKAIGEGLSFPLEDFVVSLDDTHSAKLLSIKGDKQAAENWQMHSFLPQEDYIAAVAYPDKIKQIHYWQVTF